MEYDFNKYATFGSDGGGEFYGKNSPQNIGYTDGIHYPESNWEPFETATSSVSTLKKNEKILGMTYGYFANRGEITSANGLKSQQAMFNLGINWTCLTVVNYQETYHSTRIYADHLRTPSDYDIEQFISNAHSRNIKVCLKPMIHSEDNVWRAHIGFPDLNMDDLNAYWQSWFESYKNFILRYAELAQRCGVEMLCIGCEMLGTEHRRYDWEYIIKEVRRVYHGAVVYNTNHDHEDAQEWFDCLDYIGTSAYFPVGRPDSSYATMLKNWQEVRYRLDAIAQSSGKRFIFMEVGCRSVKGASQHPWDFTQELKYSECEQEDFYRSCMNIFYDDPYFAGVFWWDWPTNLPKKKDKEFYIYQKQTERYLTDFNKTKLLKK